MVRYTRFSSARLRFTRVVATAIIAAILAVATATGTPGVDGHTGQPIVAISVGVIELHVPQRGLDLRLKAKAPHAHNVRDGGCTSLGL